MAESAKMKSLGQITKHVHVSRGDHEAKTDRRRRRETDQPENPGGRNDRRKRARAEAELRDNMNRYRELEAGVHLTPPYSDARLQTNEQMRALGKRNQELRKKIDPSLGNDIPPQQLRPD